MPGGAAWMRSAGCAKVYGLGESLGASILIQAAGLQPAFAAIVAECAYADLREIAEYRVRQMVHVPPVLAAVVVESSLAYANWIYGLDLRRVSPVESIAHASTPILLIHGLADFRTPPWNSQRLEAANPRDVLWLVPNALHTGASTAQPEEFRRRVLAWFADH
ncbi:MAG TPA: prolyl oligopeptidase family serine peptidase [Bryobacteraceae bacterium]|nr:prolyl oligopeptidase family serine peptidase [Bryobacteraceae bacterium]